MPLLTDRLDMTSLLTGRKTPTQTKHLLHVNFSFSIHIYRCHALPCNEKECNRSTGHILYNFKNPELSHVTRKLVFAICEQQRRRSACASAQSDQRLFVRCMNSIIPILAVTEISRFQLVSVAEQAELPKKEELLWNVISLEISTLHETLNSVTLCKILKQIKRSGTTHSFFFFFFFLFVLFLLS